MGKMKLKMPKTESPGNAGLNNAGIETYKNSPMLSLTKEEEQNSTDGAQKNEKGHPERVEIEFNDFNLPTSKLPDIDRVREVFEEEKIYWSGILKKDKKTIEFFENAIELLKKDTIRVLRISDKMTTGLTGVKEESSPWSNLVVNVGVSDKPADAGGSFGIGKDAAFACSNLRMVFYSTVNIEGVSATQGTLKLPSYKKDEYKYEGTGFFSDCTEKEILPVMESISLDPTYNRTESEYGLDKYIIGFDEKLSTNGLKKDVIISSIANFLVAFFKNQLEVRYGDIIVNRDKLPEVFEKYGIYFDDIDNEQYKTICNPDKVVQFSLFSENDVTFYVRLDPEASRKAAIVRSSGMKVFDKGNISGRIGFSAIITLNTDEINAYFKRLENPEHNKWAPERAEKPSEARNNMKKIFTALKEVIKEMHQEDYDHAIDSDGVNEYLPYTYIQKSKKNRIEGLSNEVKGKKKKGKKKKTPQKQDSEQIHYEVDEHGNIDENTIEIITISGSSGGDGTGNGHGKGDNANGEGFGGEGENPGNNETALGDGDDSIKLSEARDGEFIAKRHIPNDNFTFALEQNNDKYILRFISKKNIKSGFIEIDISGEEEAIISDVLEASIDGSRVNVSKNKISFTEITSDDVHTVTFRLKERGTWALEVSVNEN